MELRETRIQIHVEVAVEEDADGITAEELALRCGMHPSALEPYVRIGVITRDPASGRFPVRAVRRLRKAIRLRRDLGVNLVSLGIILDLLDRLEAMERELERLRSGG